MMKPALFAAACGCTALVLSGCGQEEVAPAASSGFSIPAEAVTPPGRPSPSRMSRKQRECFRIQETAAQLDQAIGILKRLEAGGGLKLASGDRPDLAAMENSLASIGQETKAEAADATSTYPVKSHKELDALFTGVLELEKQVVWPADSLERIEVAAHLVAASEAFESAAPSQPNGAEAGPERNW